MENRTRRIGVGVGIAIGIERDRMAFGAEKLNVSAPLFECRTDGNDTDPGGNRERKDCQQSPTVRAEAGLL